MTIRAVSVPNALRATGALTAGVIEPTIVGETWKMTSAVWNIHKANLREFRVAAEAAAAKFYEE
jgi:hypothetical protein